MISSEIYTVHLTKRDRERAGQIDIIDAGKALDDFIITDEERIEDASFGNRFRGMNEYMQWHITDYSHEPSAEQHKFNLEVDIYRMKRSFERNSPSILI